MKQDFVEFKERLQELLEEHKINRYALSKKLGVSSTTINGYFNKNYYPEIDIAIKLSRYFKCSLNYLLGLSDINNYCEGLFDSKLFIVRFDLLRKANGLSINAVMEDLKMSEYNYYRWKAGRFPKTSNLIDVAKYFDVSIDYLVGISEEK